MVTGKDRVRQIVEALLTGLAEVALTLWLGIVTPLFGNLRTVTRWTLDTIGPAEAANGLKAFGVVDEGLYVYHGARIAYWARRNKYTIQHE